jgi:hypothetical protein
VRRINGFRVGRRSAGKATPNAPVSHAGNRGPIQKRAQIRPARAIPSCEFNLKTQALQRIRLLKREANKIAPSNLRENALTYRKWIGVKASDYPETNNKNLRKLARREDCIYRKYQTVPVAVVARFLAKDLETDTQDCFWKFCMLKCDREMTSSDTVIDFDRFRRMRQLFSGMVKRAAPERNKYKTADWYLPGFVGKARVGTTFGELPIEALRPRDDLNTYAGDVVKVVAVDKVHLDEDFIRHHPRALPIRIPANAFGPGRPLNDMFVSPGQEICPDVHVASEFYKARNLPGNFTLDLSQSMGLTYYRFHCGQPAIVRVEGTWIRVQPWLTE